MATSGYYSHLKPRFRYEQFYDAYGHLIDHNAKWSREENVFWNERLAEWKRNAGQWEPNRTGNARADNPVQQSERGG